MCAKNNLLYFRVKRETEKELKLREVKKEEKEQEYWRKQVEQSKKDIENFKREYRIIRSKELHHDELNFELDFQQV